jgi:predicted CXXCH cytochrome family protein
MRVSLCVAGATALLMGLGCASGTSQGGGARAGTAAARFAAASRVYAQARQRETAGDPACALATAVRSMTRPDACVGCHDGMVEPVHVQHVTWANYVDASAAGRFRAIRDVPDAIVFANDDAGHPVMVSCTSCHAGTSVSPDHVALPLDRSSLCLGCHAT